MGDMYCKNCEKFVMVDVTKACMECDTDLVNNNKKQTKKDSLRKQNQKLREALEEIANEKVRANVKPITRLKEIAQQALDELSNDQEE